MASSGVWENVVPVTTPTCDGVCGMLSSTILLLELPNLFLIDVDWCYVNCINFNDRCHVMLYSLADVIAKCKMADISLWLMLMSLNVADVNHFWSNEQSILWQILSHMCLADVIAIVTGVNVTFL